MIILIIDDDTGMVSHGIDSNTLVDIVLPVAYPYEIGGKWNDEMGYYTLEDNQ